MQHWTEDMIREHLDGTFTRFDVVTGGVRTARVDPDHRPTHDISSTGLGNKAGYKHFSPEDDKIIIWMKAAGMSARRIAAMLPGRTDACINKRYRRLVKQGKAEAVIA